MWRVIRLHLKNFAGIYTGMNKREIDLDLSKSDKKVNIFVGKMGSGKTTILGQLQPYSTYGTLDIRNQESLILKNEDGLKEIEYAHNGHIYKIQHKYIWSDKTGNHSTKTYIQLDEKELNENGNYRSGREIIKREFGIDQNFLRLLRLGPNVSNLINMKATERKAFIASLLEDTEIYTMLHQKVSDDYRSINGAIQLLSNKLVGFNSDENTIRIESESLEDDIKLLGEQSEKLKSDIATLQGINTAISNGTPLPDQISQVKDQIDLMEYKLKEIDEKLSSLPDKKLSDVLVEIGKIASQIDSITEEILKLQDSHSKVEAEKMKLRDFLLLHENNAQLEELKHQALVIEEQYEQASRKLAGFRPTYGYSFLIDFTNSTLANFQLALEDMANNRIEMITKLYRSDASIIPWATKRLDMLTGRKVNLQKLLQNIQFSAEYTVPMPLYRPPLCPTEDCPFIKTHPYMIELLNGGDKRNQNIVDLQNQIESISREISECEEYIAQYPRMQNIKKTWESVSRTLTVIGALEEKSLARVLTNLDARNNWYSYDLLISYTEKAKIYEGFSAIESQRLRIQNEVAQLSNTDVESKRQEFEKVSKELEDILLRLEELQTKRNQYQKDKDSTESIIEILTNKEAFNAERKDIEIKLAALKNELESLMKKSDEYSQNTLNIQRFQDEYNDIEVQYKIKAKRFSELQVILQEMVSTKSSYDEYITERDTLKLILGALSSKDGIPLIMVKVFLEECKEIINDLISDIFDDDLEILEFNVSPDSNEFRIPYRVNGSIINDIELASQGQQAVISIAISFALCQRAMFDYNIMLLDEIDNSIHKSDRERFIMILTKQMQAVGADQVFMITHNDIFQQSWLPVNIIMTTDEVVDEYSNKTVIRL